MGYDKQKDLLGVFECESSSCALDLLSFFLVTV